MIHVTNAGIKCPLHFGPVSIGMSASQKATLFLCCLVESLSTWQLGRASGNAYNAKCKKSFVFLWAGIPTSSHGMASDLLGREVRPVEVNSGDTRSISNRPSIAYLCAGSNHTLQLLWGAGRSRRKYRSCAMQEMHTIRRTDSFRRAIHIVGPVTTVNMEIHKSRRNIAIGYANRTHARCSGLVAIYARDPPAPNHHTGVCRNAIGENEISSEAKVSGHSLSIKGRMKSAYTRRAMKPFRSAEFLRPIFRVGRRRCLVV